MYENPLNKRRYLKVGDLKENIRNLKKENKITFVIRVQENKNKRLRYIVVF